MRSQKITREVGYFRLIPAESSIVTRGKRTLYEKLNIIIIMPTNDIRSSSSVSFFRLSIPERIVAGRNCGNLFS
jgi:hypothetical protein